MGLRCLLGHDFGPSGVVREHEEDGSEMVVTEREIRRCKRCGEEQVLSESTEVRAIRMEEDVRSERRDADAVAPARSTQGADVGDETSPLSADASEPTGGDELSPETTPDTAALHDAAESVTGPSDADAASAAETAPDVGSQSTGGDDAADSNTSLIERAEEGFDEPADPAEEDAVILDEDAPPERERGDWPDSGDTHASSGSSADAESPADPADVTGHDAGVDTGHGDRDGDDGEAADRDESRSLAERAAEEDAELMDSASDDATADSAGASSSSSTAEGAWPSHESEDEGFSAGEATSGGPSMAYGSELTPQSTNGQSREQGAEYETSYLDNTVEQRDGDGTIVSAATSGSSTPRPGVETEYYCPNCGHSRPLDSSLRSGDICPECQQGYIAERER